MKHSTDQSTIYEDAFTYDQIHHAKSLGKDTKFYLSLSKNNQKVLEIACGTGRVTIPLSEAGLDMTALDLSESMLKEAQLKAEQSSVKINWVHADCTNFSLNENFDLIFMTGNSLQHLHTDSQVKAFFQCVKKHLREDGIFSFDIFRPSLKILTRDPLKKYHMVNYKNIRNEDMKLEESNSYDEITQINRIQWFHSNLSSGHVKVDTLEMRQFFPQELKLLLKTNGFKILQTYGDWDLGQPSDRNFQQIVVAQLVN